MKVTDFVDRYVIGRESNVLRVDFHPEREPPAPRFPGAGALRYQQPFSESVDAVAPLYAASRQCR